MPGGTQYSIKLDGFRAVAFVSHEVVLQSRSGRNLATEFPELAEAITAALPAGSVVDGEIVAYRGGRMVFEELLRSHAARVRDQVPVSFIAFDVLATPDRGDIRGLPLSERWDLLGDLLGGAGPQVQRVLATTSLAEARVWYEQLQPVGVEGIVARSLSSTYRVPSGRAWMKVRHTETVDAQLVGIIGSPAYPRTVLVRLPDGTQAATSPQLLRMQSRQVAEAVAGRLTRATADPEHNIVHWLTTPLPVEVQVGTGRHGTVRFVRLRSTD